MLTSIYEDTVMVQLITDSDTIKMSIITAYLSKYIWNHATDIFILVDHTLKAYLPYVFHVITRRVTFF